MGHNAGTPRAGANALAALAIVLASCSGETSSGPEPITQEPNVSGVGGSESPVVGDASVGAVDNPGSMLQPTSSGGPRTTGMAGSPTAGMTAIDDPPGVAEPSASWAADSGTAAAPLAMEDSPQQQDDPEGSTAVAEPTTALGLPEVADPGADGPFEIEEVTELEGLPSHVLIAPVDLGRDGIKHPILVWTNGAGLSSVLGYRAMLENVAAHGFFILDDKQSTFEAIPEIDTQRAAIDWAVAQAQDERSPYYGKLDATHIALGGHSLGSVASFGNVADSRLTTSVHIAGGVTDNPGNVDNSLIEELRAPTLFLCGSADRGITRVENDYAKAPAEAPVFFGILEGADHFFDGEFDKPNGGRWGRIFTAWLRWHLAADPVAEAMFTGDDCEFCTGDWTARKQNLD